MEKPMKAAPDASAQGSRPLSAPKTIVLFSDGTGNSSAKLFRTNVWRLYQALDLAEPNAAAGQNGSRKQIAYYDDGVGTSSFKLWALLGGAIGLGLQRNVLDLYTFLCRNYNPGDKIYAFGFSRGAFTIRVLVGLVTTEGIIADRGDGRLAYSTLDAYRVLRRSFNQTGGLVSVLRKVRDAVVSTKRRLTGEEVYDSTKNFKDVRFAFVGVWDTVAAYGLPIAELTRGIDRWVWPLSMPDYVLSDKVDKACQALSLDDERDTFHPLLWDEVEEERMLQQGKVKPGRLEQVWFAGVHSDVGGGYPDDALSYVSLDWMMGKATAAGLTFKRHAAIEVRRAKEELAPIHDSRSGLAAYYRYQPRKISARIEQPDRTTLIMQDPDFPGRGLLKSVKIHESVFNRIRSGFDGYAPVVIPGTYQIVSSNGATVVGGELDPNARAVQQELVWNEIWKRRVVYFLTVGASLFLALMPFTFGRHAVSACQGPQCILSPIFATIGNVAPGFLQPWIEAFGARPGVFAIGVGVLSALLLLGGSLQRRSHDGMRELWVRSLGLPDGAASTQKGTAMGLPSRGIYTLRTAPAYQHFFRFLKWRAAPTVFGVSVLGLAAALIVAIPSVGVHRVRLALAERSNAICVPEAPTADAETVAAANSFSPKAICWRAPDPVQKGDRYRVSVALTERWQDGAVGVSPDGSGSEQLPWYVRYGAVPLRRSLTDGWFQPMVKIVPPNGSATAHTQTLPMRCADDPKDRVCIGEFAAAESGELYMFVNDAILSPLGLTTAFYDNNRGGAEVRVEPEGGEWDRVEAGENAVEGIMVH